MTELCTTALRCVYDFQTIASGGLAVLAALIGGAYVLRSSRLPVEAQKQQTRELETRRAAHVCRVIGVEFERVAELADQAASTIKVVIAAGKDVTDTVRSKTIIEPHPLIDDVDSMALLPPHLSRMALSLRHALLRHNFDMRRAGGSFGDSNFQAHVQDQARDLASHARQMSQQFLDYGARLSKRMLDEKRE